MSIRTIIFDFGNVLGFFSHQRSAERLAQHSSLSAAEIRAQIVQHEREHLFEMGLVSVQEFVAALSRDCRLHCSQTVAEQLLADIFWPNEALCQLVPKLKQRYRLLLASNTNALHAPKFCEQFAPTLGLLDHLVLSHEIGARKPNAPFYEHCQAHAQCEPSECFFIDDLPTNIEAAHAHGWQGIIYHDHAQLLQRFTELGIQHA